MASRTLAVEYLSVASLRLNPQNPRLHNDKQVRQLANSIRSFGFNVPVLVDAHLQARTRPWPATAALSFPIQVKI